MRYALALDVGGTTIKSGIVSENSSISHAGSTPTPANPEKLIETSAQIVADLDALVRSGNAIGENGRLGRGSPDWCGHRWLGGQDAVLDERYG